MLRSFDVSNLAANALVIAMITPLAQVGCRRGLRQLEAGVHAASGLGPPRVSLPGPDRGAALAVRAQPPQHSATLRAQMHHLEDVAVVGIFGTLAMLVRRGPTGPRAYAPGSRGAVCRWRVASSPLPR